MSIARVIYNRDLFTLISSFIDPATLRKITTNMRGLVHYNYAIPSYNTLLYGEVQSGKTSKIMRYIQYYPITTVKVLMIQNNITMMSQYKNALEKLRIPFCCISTKYAENVYRNEKVILVIHNKFRMKALDTFINKHKLTNYSLILDESDQYYSKIMKEKICTDAKHILHVTATPFIYKKILVFRDFVKIKPAANYVGINKINIIEVGVVFEYVDDLATRFNKRFKETKEIVSEFMGAPRGGMMLINCAHRVEHMTYMGVKLSQTYPDTPIIVLATSTQIYQNNKIVNIKVKNIQHLIDQYNANSHIIIIANRYSSRGVNYTNKEYTRFITHQVSCENSALTNFIQKCRIFGNRPSNDIVPPVLYCITNTHDYVSKLKRRLSFLVTNINTPIEENLISDCKKIKKPELIKMCKEQGIKGYSKLKKQEIIDLLKSRIVDL